MPKDRAAMPARALARDGEKEGGVMMRTRVVVDPPSFRPRPWRVVSDQTSRGASIFLRRDHSQVALIENLRYLWWKYLGKYSPQI